MNSKQIAAIFMLCVIFIVPLYVFVLHWGSFAKGVPLRLSTIRDGSFVNAVNQFIGENMPLGTELQQLAISIGYNLGKTEQNGIFITEDCLLEDLKEPDAGDLRENRLGIEDFVQKTRKPTYLLLVPTAIAIKQQEVPEYAAGTLFNQKSFIEEIYSGFSGTVSVVDVYPALFAAKDQYIYYKTQSNLTGLGGYSIYSVLGRRLGLTPLKGLDQFDIAYWDNGFYGDIYEKSPYKNVTPDVISLYEFSKYRREYQVTHYEEDGQRAYYTLYPQSAPTLGKKMDIFFGGRSPIVEFKMSTGSQDNLLIFGDDTVESFLPFLLVHYDEVTVVDLSTISEELLKTVHPEGYEQVLLSYSVDTYMHTDQLAKLEQFAPRER